MDNDPIKETLPTGEKEYFSKKSGVHTNLLVRIKQNTTRIDEMEPIEGELLPKRLAGIIGVSW